MSFDIDNFQDFLETAESAQNRELENIRLGRKLVTAREVGIFYPPDTPPRLMNQKIWLKPTLEEWEKSAGETQRRLAALIAEETEPAKEPNSTLTSIPLTR